MPSWYGNWQQVQPLTDKSMDLLTRSLGNLSNAWQGLGNSGINYLQREIDRRDLIDAKNRASNTQNILNALNQADTLQDKEALQRAGYTDFGALRSLFNTGQAGFDERVINQNLNRWNTDINNRFMANENLKLSDQAGRNAYISAMSNVANMNQEGLANDIKSGNLPITALGSFASSANSMSVRQQEINLEEKRRQEQKAQEEKEREAVRLSAENKNKDNIDNIISKIAQNTAQVNINDNSFIGATTSKLVSAFNKAGYSRLWVDLEQGLSSNQESEQLVAKKTAQEIKNIIDSLPFNDAKTFLTKEFGSMYQILQLQEGEEVAKKRIGSLLKTTTGFNLEDILGNNTSNENRTTITNQTNENSSGSNENLTNKANSTTNSNTSTSMGFNSENLKEDELPKSMTTLEDEEEENSQKQTEETRQFFNSSNLKSNLVKAGNTLRDKFFQAKNNKDGETQTSTEAVSSRIAQDPVFNNMSELIANKNSSVSASENFLVKTDDNMRGFHHSIPTLRNLPILKDIETTAPEFASALDSYQSNPAWGQLDTPSSNADMKTQAQYQTAKNYLSKNIKDPQLLREKVNSYNKFMVDTKNNLYKEFDQKYLKLADNQIGLKKILDIWEDDTKTFFLKDSNPSLDFLTTLNKGDKNKDFLASEGTKAWNNFVDREILGIDPKTITVPGTDINTMRKTLRSLINSEDSPESARDKIKLVDKLLFLYLGDKKYNDLSPVFTNEGKYKGQAETFLKPAFEAIKNLGNAQLINNDIEYYNQIKNYQVPPSVMEGFLRNPKITDFKTFATGSEIDKRFKSPNIYEVKNFINLANRYKIVPNGKPEHQFHKDRINLKNSFKDEIYTYMKNNGLTNIKDIKKFGEHNYQRYETMAIQKMTGDLNEIAYALLDDNEKKLVEFIVKVRTKLKEDLRKNEEDTYGKGE